MHLESVAAKNFMSYATLERRFDDKRVGLTLIEGFNRDEGDSNGAGKSTPWDLVSWVLFGETVRGSKGDDVIHRPAGKDTEGQVRLSAVLGNYTVTRFRKSTAKDKAGMPYGNRLVYTYVPHDVGGPDEMVELGSIDATQKRLLEELGVDFELFRCTVLFAQGETFNFVDETDKRQKEILSKIKRLDVKKGLDAVRKDLRAMDDTKFDLERKIEVLKSHVVIDPAALYAIDAKTWDEDRASRIAGVDETLVKLRTEQESLLRVVHDAEGLSGARERLIEMRTEREEKVKDLGMKVRRPREDKLAVLRHRRERIAKFTDAVCPLCEQSVDRKKIAVERDELAEKIAISLEALEKVEGIMDKLIAQQQVLERKILEVNVAIVERGRNRARLERIIPEMDHCRVLRERAEAEANPWTAKAAEAVAKQKQIAAKIKELKKSLISCVANEPYLRFWDVGFSDKGLKSFVFDTVCASLTAKANHYLNILAGGAVGIAFDTQTKLKTGELREKFECLVMTDGAAVPYHTYSGGEKTRVSLAVDMALADLMTDSYGTHFNVVVFDEQDLYLDRQGRQNYLALLKERAKSQRVFVVAHDQEFKGMFDDSWIVEKKDRVSSFVA